MSATRARRIEVAGASLTSLSYLFDEATKFFPVPGGVVSVIDREGLLGERSFGFADVERGIAMSSSLRFEIGSISKFFTALAVNRLIDDGRLQLHETIADVLPWLALSHENLAVSVARLLNHTSGMSVGADTLPDDAGEIWNSRECASSTATSPNFHYSNLGYLILGEMVRARSGQRLADFVQKQWLGPLGMSNALAQVTQADKSSLATGYWPTRPDHPWAPGDALSPSAFFEIDSASGNIAATSADMTALVQALLGASGGDPVMDAEAKPVLSPALFERMTSDLAPTGEPTYVHQGVSQVQESRYAMGINVERIDGHLCVSHGGGMVGYSTFMLVDCTARIGVVVLTNANGDTLASHLLARIVHDDVLRRLNGRDSLDGLSFDLTVRAGADPVDGAVPGHYVGDDETELDVFLEGDEMRIRYGDETGRLFRLIGGRYVTDNPGLRTFHLDWYFHGEERGFTYGATTYRNVHGGGPVPSKTGAVHPLVGRYRSFSPWFPEFRILERGGALLLVAPGGVEAPGEEEVLVEVAWGEYRIGSEEWLPERLRINHVRDGEVISVVRDGCHYSRAFSD